MRYWIHATIPNPGFEQVMSLLEGEHKKNLPQNNLSIAYNLAGTEAIIKVVSDDAWMQSNVNSRPWVNRIYTDADHSEIFQFFNGPDWQEVV